MSLFNSIILTVQMLSALAMIVLILIQHGKGADMGAAFGSGASGSLFGASGGANFLSRTTAVLAAVFFVCTLVLAYSSNARPASSGSILETPAAVMPAAPDTNSQIPAPTGSAGTVPPAAPAAGGAAQIPTK